MVAKTLLLPPPDPWHDADDGMASSDAPMMALALVRVNDAVQGNKTRWPDKVLQDATSRACQHIEPEGALPDVRPWSEERRTDAAIHARIAPSARPRIHGIYSRSIREP